MKEELNNNYGEMPNHNYKKKDNSVKVLLTILIILALCLIGLISYEVIVCSKKCSNNTTEKNNNEKYLNLSNFPYADDNADKEYIYIKGSYLILGNYISGNNRWYVKENNIEVDPGFLDTAREFSYKDITFNLDCADIEKSYANAYIYSYYCKSATLNLERGNGKDKRSEYVYYEGSINPYIIMTNNYIVILNNNDTSDSNNFIYVYDYEFNLVKIIKNVSYGMTGYSDEGMFGTLDFLNGSTNIAIVDNVLYYVTSLDDVNMNFECLDLSQKEIKSITLEQYNYKDKVNRNTTITSINQAPFTKNYIIDPSTIGKHKVEIDNTNDIIIIDDKNEYNYVTRFVNPNGFETDSLGYNSSIQILNNCIYYVKDNKDNTLSLMKIDLNNEKITEEVVDTFTKLLK